MSNTATAPPLYPVDQVKSAPPDVGYQPQQQGVYYPPPAQGPQYQQYPQYPPGAVPVGVYGPGQYQAQPVMVVSSGPVQSFTCHIILACAVFWCCGCLFGLIAFILAMVAQGKAVSSSAEARQLGNASIGVSIAAIIIGIIVVIAVVVNAVQHPLRF